MASVRDPGKILAAAWVPVVVSAFVMLACQSRRTDAGPSARDTPKVVVDTAAPPMPASWTERLDTALTVPAPWNRNARYFRHRFMVAFKQNASGREIRDILARYRATVVGGEPRYKPRGAYFIGIPDPGADGVRWKAIYDSLAAEPSVALAVAIEANARLERTDR